MKFLYQYRTSDNQTYSGVINAVSKDAAYSTLRAQGIRPSRMEEAPGLFNKLFGKGKRWIAIVVLALIAAGSTLVAYRMRHEVELVVETYSSAVDRHQIYGDPGYMGQLEREHYESVFTDPGDRYLAHFAQPGAVVRFSNQNWREDMANALKGTLASPLEIDKADNREVRELKQIVLGMRDELRAYLANGIGTYSRFVKRVEERQIREAQIYYQAKNELAKEKDPAVFEKRNESLRRLGLRTISAPEND